MAKKTKDSNLSLEEKLEQALIPNWDEPYKLPDNWCWTKIGVVSNLYRGVSYKKHEGHSEKGKDDCLVMRGGNIQEGKIDIDSDNIYVSKELISDEQHIRKHDVVIVSSTGSTKVIGRAGISFADYDDVAFGAFLTLVRPIERVYKPYVAYFFQGDMYRNRMRQLASGVNINNIRNEFITDTPIPLPPLSEQQRIVARIESLFAKLDEAKEKAQEVVDGFETRKAAILHKAFSGELTAKWREENGVDIESWQQIVLGDYADSQYGYTESSSFELIGPKFLRITDIQNGQVDWKSVPYCKITASDKEKYSLKFGDIVVARTGATTGKSYLIVDEVDAVYASYLIRVSIKSHDLINSYLYTFMQSPNYWQQISELSSGIAQPGVNGKKLQKLELPLPIAHEQLEIVSICENLLSKESRAKEIAEAVIEQIDAMKKAILARAFRGELGTNDPSEENAVELLKKMLDTALKPKKPMKRVAIPKSLDNRIKTDLERKIIKLYIQNDTDILPINLIMGVSSKKFEIIETLRNLQQRELLEKQNDNYKLLG